MLASTSAALALASPGLGRVLLASAMWVRGVDILRGRSMPSDRACPARNSHQARASGGGGCEAWLGSGILAAVAVEAAALAALSTPCFQARRVPSPPSIHHNPNPPPPHSQLSPVPSRMVRRTGMAALALAALSLAASLLVWHSSSPNTLLGFAKMGEKVAPNVAPAELAPAVLGFAKMGEPIAPAVLAARHARKEARHARLEAVSPTRCPKP